MGFIYGLVTFGMALTIPEHEADQRDELARPAFYATILMNDLKNAMQPKDMALPFSMLSEFL